MAKRRTTRGAAKKDRAPKAKSKKKKPAPVAEVEVVEEAGGEGIDTGIVVLTSVVLLAAILFIDKLRGVFDAGIFFNG